MDEDGAEVGLAGQVREGARARLGQLETELVAELGAKQRRWSAVYRALREVCDGQLWRAAGYTSQQKWLEDLSRRAHCTVTYLHRVRKAGQAYERYMAEARVAGREVPGIDEVQMGDEMLYDIDRVSDGNSARMLSYIDAAVAGRLTKAEVKRIVQATAGTRRPGRKSRAEREAREGSPDGAPKVSASDILAAVRPEVFLPADALARVLLRGARRVWWVHAEFPVPTGDADRARRIDALAVTNAEAGGDDQYSVVLRGVEIKVSESDLRGDQKKLDYEPYVDEMYLAVPDAMAELAAELAPDGWGVLAYDAGEARLRVAVRAARRPGEMRGVAMATALVKSLPSM